MADGLESVREARKKFLRDVQAALTAGVDQANKLLYEEMRMLISRIDHSLKQLREEGHPYRQDAPAGTPHPDWIVHIQDGKLLAGIEKLPASVEGRKIEAVILSHSPYTWYLLLGTRKMRPRDFVSAAMIMRRTEIENIIANAYYAVHDRVVGQLQPVEFHYLEHAVYPAQLPGES